MLSAARDGNEGKLGSESSGAGEVGTWMHSKWGALDNQKRNFEKGKIRLWGIEKRGEAYVVVKEQRGEHVSEQIEPDSNNSMCMQE